MLHCSVRYILAIIAGVVLLLCLVACYMSLEEAMIEDERDYSVIAYENYEVKR